MNFRETYERIKELLTDIPDRNFDAMCIFEHFIAQKEELLTYPERECPEDSLQKAVNACHKRVEGYPLQYILGLWEFYGYLFKVGEGVLIPRPDTELLVERALEIIDRKFSGSRLSVVDLCSGSGCIAISLAKQRDEKVKMFAVETSGDAFPYLIDNISLNNAHVITIRGDISNGHLIDNFVDEDGEELGLDIIVSNPPYLTDEEMQSLQRELEYEPEMALYGGNDGLKYYRIICTLWGSSLRKGGSIVLEIGDGQAEAVKEILESSGFANIEFFEFAGLTRVVTAERIK